MSWFLFNALVILFFLWIIAKKYGTLLNPASLAGGTFMIQAVIAPLLFDSFDMFNEISRGSINYTSALSSVYFISFGTAFAIRCSPFKNLFRLLFRIVRPLNSKIRNSSLSDFGMLLQFVLLFLILMFASGAGLLWLTNSREAYQLHRVGVGVFWSLCQATLMLTFICVVLRKGKSYIILFVITCFFAVISLFLGSKGFVLTYFVIALFYAHFQVKQVSNKAIVLFGTCIFQVFFVIQLYQQGPASLRDSVLYFDFFRDSAEFLDRFKEFGFRYGQLTLSSFWDYIPRWLYHAKPFVYGQVIVDEMLFPGAAENGYATPGMMTWTAGYGDFGMLGVILYGLFDGFLVKGAYELFLDRKDIQSMALFAQIGLGSMFWGAPFPVFLVWLIFQIMLIRALSMFRVFPLFRFVLSAPSLL